MVIEGYTVYVTSLRYDKENENIEKDERIT